LPHALCAGSAANGYTCAPTSKTSLLRGDGVVASFDEPSSDGMIYDSVEETGAEWAAAQGCAALPEVRSTDFDGAKGWGCEAYPDCATGAEVISCTWDGGHVWPRQELGDNPPWGLVRALVDPIL